MVYVRLKTKNSDSGRYSNIGIINSSKWGYKTKATLGITAKFPIRVQIELEVLDLDFGFTLTYS